MRNIDIDRATPTDHWSFGWSLISWPFYQEDCWVVLYGKAQDSELWHLVYHSNTMHIKCCRISSIGIPRLIRETMAPVYSPWQHNVWKQRRFCRWNSSFPTIQGGLTWLTNFWLSTKVPWATVPPMSSMFPGLRLDKVRQGASWWCQAHHGCCWYGCHRHFRSHPSKGAMVVAGLSRMKQRLVSLVSGSFLAATRITQESLTSKPSRNLRLMSRADYRSILMLL